MMLGGLFSLCSTALIAAAPVLTVDPAPVVLGKTEAIRVHVRAEGEGALRAFSSVGAFDPFESSVAAERELVWRPPSTKVPSIALLVVWRETTGAPELATLRIPLWGRTELEITTEPNAEAKVELGTQRFGPVKADARGMASVPVEVPPGTRKAKVLAQVGGRTTNRTLTLDVPETNPLSALLIPGELQAEGLGWLYVFHVDRLDPAQLQVTAEGATIERVQTIDDRAVYSVRAASGGEAIVRAQLSRVPMTQAEARATIVPKHAPPPPEPPRHRLQAGASAGAFYAGGSSGGLELGVTLGLLLPVWSGRLVSELGVSFKTAFLSGTELLLGRYNTSALVLPISVALRGRLVEKPRWAMDARLGAGIAPFRHLTHPDLQPSFSESALGFTLYAALQASYRLLPLELIGELQLGATPLSTTRMHFDAGGLTISLGARYGLF
ncbi:MAG: hypothetical protein ACT4TC_24460 [Myxococcaceae bacterium]